MLPRRPLAPGGRRSLGRRHCQEGKAMRTQRSTVIGVFSDRDKAQAAVEDLRRAGFHDDQIGLVSRTVDSGMTAIHAAGPDRIKERTGPGSAQTQWEEGAGVGAAAGAAAG